MYVAEIYSPPRMALAAKRHGLRPGWSLDITGYDPEDGKPWDLGDPAKQAKARKMVREDKPTLLIASPMCGPFSTWMHVNYAHMPEEQAEAMLTAGLKHLSFAVELCLEQSRAGDLRSPTQFILLEQPGAGDLRLPNQVWKQACAIRCYVLAHESCQPHHA